MKVIIALIAEDHAKDWAQRHGIPETDARRHFSAAVRHAVAGGAITETFDKNWPIMHGHITAHTVDGLDASTRDQLLEVLQRAQRADQHEALITAIKERLAAHSREFGGRVPCWVIFRTAEWDNGHFLTGSEASVYFADGDHVPFDFWRSSVNDILTDRYGACGSTAALGVDLREDLLEFDDYGDTMPGMLGVPRDHSDGDGGAIQATDDTEIGDGADVSITAIGEGDVPIAYGDKP